MREDLGDFSVYLGTEEDAELFNKLNVEYQLDGYYFFKYSFPNKYVGVKHRDPHMSIDSWGRVFKDIKELQKYLEDDNELKVGDRVEICCDASDAGSDWKVGSRGVVCDANCMGGSLIGVKHEDNCMGRNLFKSKHLKKIESGVKPLIDSRFLSDFKSTKFADAVALHSFVFDGDGDYLVGADIKKSNLSQLTSKKENKKLNLKPLRETRRNIN
jgi:hypothetical protein